jgi:predicted DNA-binding ribbon-helix-helix protein
MIVKYSVIISGRRTSVSLEKQFWAALKHVALITGVSVNTLIESIDKSRITNRSSAIRTFVLNHYLRQKTVVDFSKRT